MRTSFVAGNWKMNTNKAAAVALAKAVAQGAPKRVQVGVAPPSVYLDAVGQALAGSSVLLGAQDVCQENNGAFTGACSCEMMTDLGVKFILTGHSERRHVFGELPEVVAKKAAKVLSCGFVLIHCVGEKLEERDAGKTLAVVEAQLNELDRQKASDAGPDRVVIAYEPVWAIGTGRNATDDQAQEVHAFIRDRIADRWNADFAYRVRIQYGGSLKPENARALLGRNDVDGGLVGGASLMADSFLAIVNAAK
jgi:triosephosphate isomerase (TIM)